jgi:hypothetical protein
MREAARSRLADEATGRAADSAAANPFHLAATRFLSGWRAKLTSGRADEISRSAAEQLAPAQAQSAPQHARPAHGRLAQPYGDMVVVARGPLAGVAEEPSGVRER